MASGMVTSESQSLICLFSLISLPRIREANNAVETGISQITFETK